MLEPIWLHTIFRDVGYRHVSKSMYGCLGDGRCSEEAVKKQ
jgi:hypothetical protein